MNAVRLVVFVVAMLVATAITGFSQTLDASQTSTTLTLTPADYPLTIVHHYQAGTVARTYAANGTYTEPASRGLGNLVNVTVFGTATAYSVIDNEVTPGTGRTALVSFTSRNEPNGSRTGIIIIIDVIE